VSYAGSAAGSGGNMYALDAATGTVLWSFESGGSVFSAPSVVHGMLFWGSVYTRIAACPNGFNRALPPTNSSRSAFREAAMMHRRSRERS